MSTEYVTWAPHVQPSHPFVTISGPGPFRVARRDSNVVHCQTQGDPREHGIPLKMLVDISEADLGKPRSVNDPTPPTLPPTDWSLHVNGGWLCTQQPIYSARLELYEIIAKSGVYVPGEGGSYDIARKINVGDVELLQRAVVSLRKRANAKAQEVVRRIENICERYWILLPPVDGGCWRTRKPAAVTGGGVECCGLGVYA